MWKGTQQRIQLDVEADPIPESDTETHKANDDNADDSSVDEKIICDEDIITPSPGGSEGVNVKPPKSGDDPGKQQ